MSAEPRPRRTLRGTSKLPVELTSKIVNGGTSTNGAINEAQHAVANGKRRSHSEDEDWVRAVEEMEGEARKKEKMVNSKGAQGKTRTGKSSSAEGNLYDIDFILTNPKSPLVAMDISDVINYGSWMALSPESRERFCRLLPSTAFGEQMHDLDDFHPSRRKDGDQKADFHSARHSKDVNTLQTSQKSSYQVDSLDPSFFKDPHFESASRTFQDHLFTGWFTSAHRELVENHLSGIRAGSLHAPWKDEVWDRDHPEVVERLADVDGTANESSNSIVLGSEKRRGKERGASEFDLLVRKGFLKQGDIITFKHKFATLGITIEKDALISTIHPKTSAITLTSSAGMTQCLPPALLAPFPNGSADTHSLREMTVLNAAQLVTALLDINGRIARDQRPRMDSWKTLTVWQWSADMELETLLPDEAMLLERGGRQSLGTLFYLRGQAADE
ncbi:hypothetical protein ACEPAG_2862 [Sanghuangporus baumii]